MRRIKLLTADLCGTEVAQNHPHDEIDNPGVNHFPDGVFQTCRIQKEREKNAERERLRKLKRGRKPTTIRTTPSNSDGKVAALYSDEDHQDWIV